MSNENNAVTTKKIGVFRNTTHDFVCVLENHTNDDNWTLDEYVRLSEWQTVEFKSLPPEAMVSAQLTALAELRAKTVTEFTERLNQIDGRMANLRALTGPVQS